MEKMKKYKINLAYTVEMVVANPAGNSYEDCVKEARERAEETKIVCPRGVAAGALEFDMAKDLSMYRAKLLYNIPFAVSVKSQSQELAIAKACEMAEKSEFVSDPSVHVHSLEYDKTTYVEEL